jgi:hypothetical protein
MTIKIKIFSSFCDSEHCKTVFEDICEKKNMFNYGEDKEIYITNGDDYTHVIILNTAMPQLKDKQTWIIQMLEHRRTLFERVITAFPETNKKKSAVELWRAKLRNQQPAFCN